MMSGSHLWTRLECWVSHLNQIPIFYYTLFPGGTIGLFTGMSIISMIEIAYWIYKLGKAAVMEIINRHGRRREKKKEDHTHSSQGR